MVGAILGLLSLVLGMGSSASANKKSKAELDAIAAKQRIPEGVLAGENILREQAGGNIPGFENRKSEIESSVPQTINQMKDYVSGGGLISALSNIYTKSNEEKRQLNDTNSEFQVNAKNRLASYLGGVKGGAETNLQNDLNSISLAKVGVNQAGTQDRLNYTNQGLNAVSNDKALYRMLSNLLNGNGGGGGSNGSLSTAGYNSILSPSTPSEATFE